jgi:endonuclease/exonuclease/phosphatase (EEP) superfamily protein YafD
VFRFGRLEARPYGLGIALRQPGHVQRFTLAGRDAYVGEATARASGEPVTVVNVHIIAPHMASPWKVATLRRRQVRDLETYLRSAPRPLLLVGDLNATPLWPVYRRLATVLTDAAVEAARRERRRPSRTWGLPFGPRLFRIDHALVDGMIVEKVQLVPVPGSNHHALVVDVREQPRARALS